MDKKLIERCALAAMRETAISGQMGPASKEELAAIDGMSESDKALTVSMFSAFVRHFDAERGKSAVGYGAIFKAIASATKTQGGQAAISAHTKGGAA